MRTHVYRFAAEDAGATAIEYALIAMMVGIVAIGAMIAFGDSVSGKYEYITTSVTSANTSGS